MKRAIILASILFALILVDTSWATQKICLSSGEKGCRQKPLDHVPFKAVVLEFVDREDSGVGKSISRLIQRELFSLGIHDMPGRGILLAQDVAARLGIDYQTNLEELDRRFHPVGREIASFLQSQMVAWGIVLHEKDRYIIYTYLSILPDFWERDLGLQIYSEDQNRVKINAPLSQANLNFAPLSFAHSDLFSGQLRTWCKLKSKCPRGVAMHSRPDNDAPITGYLPLDTPYEFVDLHQGKWLEVRQENGEKAFLNMRDAIVAPRYVHPTGNNRRYIVRESPSYPARNAKILGRVHLSGRYPVLDIKMLGPEIPWYKIKTDVGPGWLPEGPVYPIYRMPVVHFLAGLYRYAAGDYKRAELEFRFYLDMGRNRITRSAALQLISTGRAQTTGRNRSAVEAVMEPISEALNLTPFDPAIYNLRALINLTNYGEEQKAVADFARAVELDDYNRETRNLLDGLLQTWQTNPDMLQSIDVNFDKRTEQKLKELRDKIKIIPE